MKRVLLIIVVFMSFATQAFSQIRGYELGAQLDNRRFNSYGGFFDLSDPEAINIEVAVWGFVKYPGKYMIPDYTTVLDLLSFAGGPTDDSNLDELRLYRIDENNKEQMIPFDYNDLMWEDGLSSKYKKVPKIQPKDILVVPGEPRLYFMDWFGISLSVFSALISLTILILTINKL